MLFFPGKQGKFPRKTACEERLNILRSNLVPNYREPPRECGTISAMPMRRAISVVSLGDTPAESLLRPIAVLAPAGRCNRLDSLESDLSLRLAP